MVWLIKPLFVLDIPPIKLYFKILLNESLCHVVSENFMIGLGFLLARCLVQPARPFHFSAKV